MRNFKLLGGIRDVPFERKRRKASGKRVDSRKFAALCAAEADRLGLKCGDVVVAGGVRYVFSRVCEVVEGGSPVVLAYRLKKNGKTYAEATRLERWRRV